MSEKQLGLEQAQKIIDAMLTYERSMKQGRQSSFAVADSAGVLIAFIRMDGASALSADMAINKAFTALYWKRDTAEIFEFLQKQSREIAYFSNVEKQAPIPGGVLLKTADGTIVGAIGSSGRPASEDQELALAGAKAFNES